MPVDVGLGDEGRLRVGQQDVAVLHLDEEDDVGLVVDVMMEAGVVLEVELVEEVSGLDLLVHAALESLNEPPSFVGSVNVQNTATEEFGVLGLFAERFNGNDLA